VIRHPASRGFAIQKRAEAETIGLHKAFRLCPLLPDPFFGTFSYRRLFTFLQKDLYFFLRQEERVLLPLGDVGPPTLSCVLQRPSG
jgi:hypothetical protein